MAHHGSETAGSCTHTRNLQARAPALRQPPSVFPNTFFLMSRTPIPDSPDNVLKIPPRNPNQDSVVADFTKRNQPPLVPVDSLGRRAATHPSVMSRRTQQQPPSPKYLRRCNTSCNARAHSLKPYSKNKMPDLPTPYILATILFLLPFSFPSTKRKPLFG